MRVDSFPSTTTIIALDDAFNVAVCLVQSTDVSTNRLDPSVPLKTLEACECQLHWRKDKQRADLNTISPVDRRSGNVWTWPASRSSEFGSADQLTRDFDVTLLVKFLLEGACALYRSGRQRNAARVQQADPLVWATWTTLPQPYRQWFSKFDLQHTVQSRKRMRNVGRLSKKEDSRSLMTETKHVSKPLQSHTSSKAMRVSLLVLIVHLHT